VTLTGSATGWGEPLTLIVKLLTSEGSTLVSAVITGEFMSDYTHSSLIKLLKETGTSKRTESDAPVVVEASVIFAQEQDLARIRLRLRIKWRVATSLEGYSAKHWERYSSIYYEAFPGEIREGHEAFTPQLFYNSVHVPDQTEVVPRAIRSGNLKCELFAFQGRAVQWMLRREGVEIDHMGSLRPFDPTRNLLPLTFRRVTDAEGIPCFVSNLLKLVFRDEEVLRSQIPQRVGILAEEMGLGKTVELISLIDLHRRDPKDVGTSVQKNSSGRITSSKATIIIAPVSIITQWEAEFEKHAPHLRVHRYQGLNRMSRDVDDKELVKMLLGYDVVLTTYSVLRNEVHYVGLTEERTLRHERKYKRRKSPLVSISWWRVCLDEAQMVEDGVSAAAIVARLLPSKSTIFLEISHFLDLGNSCCFAMQLTAIGVNAWAVTGTPVQKDVADLLGLLSFLRYEPFARDNALWNRFLNSYQDSFRLLFNGLALRHTKERVRDEISLPPQRRIAITLPFTQIEESHYRHLFQQMCDECYLDSEGGPVREDWQPNNYMEKMRSWLLRLRQTCLHPEVGVNNRRALGRGQGPLRTVDEGKAIPQTNEKPRVVF
jgi:E3 ubiquitin-protein ligase SHPRH